MIPPPKSIYTKHLEALAHFARKETDHPHAERATTRPDFFRSTVNTVSELIAWPKPSTLVTLLLKPILLVQG